MRRKARGVYFSKKSLSFPNTIINCPQTLAQKESKFVSFASCVYIHVYINNINSLFFIANYCFNVIYYWFSILNIKIMQINLIKIVSLKKIVKNDHIFYR